MEFSKKVCLILMKFKQLGNISVGKWFLRKECLRYLLTASGIEEKQVGCFLEYSGFSEILRNETSMQQQFGLIELFSVYLACC